MNNRYSKMTIRVIVYVVALFIFVMIMVPKNKPIDNSNNLEEYINKIECDNSSFIKNDVLYVHCIGEVGTISKYEYIDGEIEKEDINFDYSNTPNISEIHINIDGVDDDYIYLKSAVKNDDSIKDGEYVKCSFKTKACEYHNGIVISNIELDKKKDVQTNTFRKYYKTDNRELYLTNNINEVYLEFNGDRVKLIDYFKKSYRSFEDSVNSITNLMIVYSSMYDGGTTIYKSDNLDITLIKCNRIGKSKDIYIGDYSLEYDESMCNR